MSMKSARRAAPPNRKRRSPTKLKDGGPPTFRNLPEPGPGIGGPEGTVRIEDRHLRRVLENVLIEVRACRQHVMWLHEMLSQYEMGKQAGIVNGKELSGRAAEKLGKKNQAQMIRDLLAQRASAGVPNGGKDLTEEEKQRLANGESVEDVLGL